MHFLHHEVINLPLGFNILIFYIMRIVFVNLHGNEFLVKTLNKIIFKQSVAIKHKYLLDYLLRQPDIEVCSYINEKGFSLASELNPWVMRLLYPFRFLEHRIVMRKNNIPLKKIKVIRKISDLRTDDIMLLYQFGKTQFYRAKEIPCLKAVSMVHFTGDMFTSKLLEDSDISILWGESELTQFSDIFKRNYKWYDKEMIVLPFVPEQRFKNVIPFNERENRAFATGTITYRDEPFHTDIYGDPCVQPSRKQIKDHAEELKAFIECTSSDYLEDAKEHQIKKERISFLTKLYVKTHTSQKKYYSFNMVDSFNHYKMCIVGEEIVGQPGIGFVEGMACGCAYIGQNKGYYEKYGMQAGVHYIAYDGSLEDLKSKIAFYQMPEHQDELMNIAKAGNEFVQNNFKGDVVARKLLEELQRK